MLDQKGRAMLNRLLHQFTLGEVLAAYVLVWGGALFIAFCTLV